jgi:hypothetical protein
MTVSREQVYQALFALLTPLGPGGSGDFKTVTREVYPVQSWKPGEQPVLMLDEAYEDSQGDKFGLITNKWTSYIHIGITTTKGTPGATILNPLIDKVEAAIWPTTKAVQTLGGLIYRISPKGRAMKDTGDNMTDPKARQAVYYMPLEIIFPDTANNG